MGAMKLVAASHPPEDLNRLGMHMYVSISSFSLVTASNLCPDLGPSCADRQNEFKPEVEQWGQKGTLSLAKILDCAKGPVDLSVDAAGEVPDEVEEMAKLEAGAGAGPSLSRQGSMNAKPVNSTTGGEGDPAQDDGDESDLSEAPSPSAYEPVSPQQGSGKKRQKMMTTADYDALLDEDAYALEGGFLEDTGLDPRNASR